MGPFLYFDIFERNYTKRSDKVNRKLVCIKKIRGIIFWEKEVRRFAKIRDIVDFPESNV
jgi:hypothetical protein